MASLNGRIICWDRAKGYGYLEAGGQRVFLHHREFVERHKAPEVGDVITFEPGRDAKGRTCATQAVHHNDGGRLRLVHLIALAALLIAPAIATWRLVGIHDLQLMLGWYAAASGLTYFAYADDKKRARRNEWRVSEGSLHIFELAGGWPGAFIAQRRLRHKSAKTGYQVVFWLVVAIHQYAAVDYLLEWRLTRAAADTFTAVSALTIHFNRE